MAVPDRAAPYVIGAGVASACWYLVLIAVQLTGTTRQMLGTHGEEWTSDALRRLRRGGWQLVEHIPLEWGDIDHALVGPGGAIAVETKASSNRWDLDAPDEWLVRAVGQAQKGARQLRRLLLAEPAHLRVAVRPLLVLWGTTTGTQRFIDDVEIVHGSDLRAWCAQLPSDVLSATDVERGVRGLNSFVERRDRHIRSREGALPLLVEFGPFGILGRVTTGVLGGLLSFISLGILIRIISDHALIPSLAMWLVIGVAGHRIARLRLLALGWLTMSAAFIALLAGLYVITWVR